MSPRRAVLYFCLLKRSLLLSDLTLCFSLSLNVFDKYLCNHKRLFPETLGLFPNGYRSEILKYNSLLPLQPHFQRVLMWKTIKNPKNPHFVYVKLTFSYDQYEKLPNFRTTDNLKTVMKSYWRPKYCQGNLQKCIFINYFRIFIRLG